MHQKRHIACAIGLVFAGILSSAGAMPTAAQTVERPLAKEKNPLGDIQDSQVFITYKSPLGFSLKVPEGWSRTERTAGVRFADKYGTIDVAISTRVEPLTSATARAMEAIKLQQSGRAVKIRAIKIEKWPAGNTILLKYAANSAMNPVTGKQIRLEHNRYLIAQNGKLATVDFSAPVGADNVDQWQSMSRSFAW